MPNKSLAWVLGEFVSTVRTETLSEAALEESRIRLLDALGCAIAGAKNVTTKHAEKWAHRASGTGASTYWFSGEHGMAQDCAFANSIFVHSILHEDAGSSGHPACNVVPSALAVGESEGASGVEVLAAIALGYEIQARIAARGTVYKHARAGAFRWTAMTGIFGAAVAATRLMKLSPVHAKNAIAFCASLCSAGVEEPLNVGSFERCIQMGQLTRSGVLAAELAWAGLDGADGALDGDCGFYAAYMGADAPVDVISGGLGTTWLSVDTRGTYIYKPYPTAALNIAATYCAEKINLGEKFSHADVTQVLVRQSWWDRNTGYIFTGPFKTVEQALMSAPFAVATALISGKFDWPAVEKALGNPDVDALAKKVVMLGVMGAAHKRYESASVDVTLRDGRELRAATDAMPPGTIAMNWEQAVQKFNAMTRHNMTGDVQARIATEIRELDRRPNVGTLVGCLHELKS